MAVAAAAVWAGLSGPAHASSINMDFEFNQVQTVGDRTGDSADDSVLVAGGIWVDPDGDVAGEHNLSTNPDTSGTPLGNLPGTVNGHYAAQWEFTVTGSSGDNWDPVLAGGTWQFDSRWDGELLSDNTPTNEPADSFDQDPLYFSHVGSATLGSWVQNNNSAETPGATLDPVWTYLEIDNTTSLTGSTGIFGVVAEDPSDVLGLHEPGTRYDAGHTNGDPWATYVGTAGSGDLTATPTPSAVGIGLGLFGLLGASRGRGRRRRDEADGGEATA